MLPIIPIDRHLTLVRDSPLDIESTHLLTFDVNGILFRVFDQTFGGSALHKGEICCSSTGTDEDSQECTASNSAGNVDQGCMKGTPGEDNCAVITVCLRGWRAVVCIASHSSVKFCGGLGANQIGTSPLDHRSDTASEG